MHWGRAAMGTAPMAPTHQGTLDVPNAHGTLLGLVIERRYIFSFSPVMILRGSAMVPLAWLLSSAERSLSLSTLIDNGR